MSNTNYTITESYILPSKGLVYDREVDPEVSLRSMTTADEMRRLAPTETPYKVMSEIIEGCMIKKPNIKVYDMCIGDYQYLLHRLRVVTYGPDYKMQIRCLNCGEISDSVANLDDLEVLTYDESIQDLLKIHLPVSDKDIELRLQTPRILDEIETKSKELKRKIKDKSVDPSILYTIQSLIKKVDGQTLTPTQLEEFVKKLPMRDTNYLLQTANKLNRKLGVDTSIVCKCSQCGYDNPTTFRITSEFFGPSLD